MEQPRDPARGSTAALFGDVVQGIGALVQGEIALARAEVSEGLQAAAGGVARIAIAGIVALVALNVLAMAGVAALVAAGLAAHWAGLVVALALGLVALMLALSGRAALQIKGIMPRRSLRNIDRDMQTIKTAIAAEGVGHV